MTYRIAGPPLPVEIVNHTNWLSQWLPAFSSATVALIALGGVLWSNRRADKRSKQDREDARHRGILDWKRGQILRLGAEAIEAFTPVYGYYFGLFVDTAVVRIPGDWTYADETPRERIHLVAVSLSLLSADDAAEKAAKLREAVEHLALLVIAMDVESAWPRNKTESEAAIRPLISAQTAFQFAIKRAIDELSPQSSA